jgi:hypothetical protein
MHFYRNLHVLCIHAHPQLVVRLKNLADRMKEIFLSCAPDRELRCCMLLMEFMLALDEHREEFAPEIKSGEAYSYTDSAMHRMILVTDSNAPQLNACG